MAQHETKQECVAAFSRPTILKKLWNPELSVLASDPVDLISSSPGLLPWTPIGPNSWVSLPTHILSHLFCHCCLEAFAELDNKINIPSQWA